MKISGLSREHLELIVEMEELEKVFVDPDYTGRPETAAKALTCLACDYASIGLEEETHRLLLKADELCPDYHRFQMLLDAQEPEFGLLVQYLAKELIIIALSTVRDNKEFKR